MKRHNIELHIEELVLDGFASGDRYRIAEAVERELATLFQEEGAPQSLIRGGERELHGGTFVAARGSNPEAIGARVAQALYGGMKR